jgi:PAS domain-containing protein
MICIAVSKNNGSRKCNPAFTQILGYTQKETGRPDLSPIHPEAGPHEQKNTGRASRRGQYREFHQSIPA